MIRTILVIEDDVLTRNALVRELSQADFEVLEAASGSEGLAVATDKHPDLIITDLNLPEMDGHEMLAELRKDIWGKQAKVVILSANDTSASLNIALQEGVTAYFSKAETDIDALISQISALG